MQPMSQSNFREEGSGFGFDSGGVATLHERRHAGIFQRREFGEQVMELEDEPDPFITELRLLRLGHAKEVLPIERDGSAARFIKRADNVEQGALAGPGGAHNGDQLAALNLKIDSLEHGHFVGSHRERLMQIGDVNHVQW